MTTKKVIEPPSPSSVKITDPRYPIWGRIFQCRMPPIAHYSMQYLERYGLHSSGNDDIDRAMALKPVLCYITINAMVEYYHQSGTVRIVKQADVKTIYEICQDYIFDWADIMRHGTLALNVPFNDLIMIDEFSEAVYQYAQFEYGKEFARTFVNEEVQNNIKNFNDMFAAVDKKVKGEGTKKVDTVTVRNIFSSPLTNRDLGVSTIEKDKKADMPERPSPREMFLSYMNRSGVASK